VVPGRVEPVDLLEQQAPAHRAHLDAARGPPGHAQQPDVLLGGEDLERLRLEVRGQDHLGEHGGHLRRHRGGHGPVRRDDPTERRERVAGVRLRVGLSDVGAHGDAARVRVLDDRDGGSLVVVRGAPGGVGVDVVVVAHLLAVQLLGLGEPWRAVPARVQRRALVRVLAVAQHVRAVPRGAHPGREAGGDARDVVRRGQHVPHPGRDVDVVRGGVDERSGGQRPPLGEGEASGRDGVDHLAVARRMDDDGDARVVLRRGADHGRPADVDLLDALLRPGAGRDRRGEGVEVDHHEVERRDVQIGQLRHVLGLATVGEDAGVDPRVEGLDAPVEALGEAGDLLDGCDRNAGGGDRGSGGTRGDDLYPGGVQRRRQVHEPGLVVDREQGAAHRDPVGGREVLRTRGGEGARGGVGGGHAGLSSSRTGHGRVNGSGHGHG